MLFAKTRILAKIISLETNLIKDNMKGQQVALNWLTVNITDETQYSRESNYTKLIEVVAKYIFTATPTPKQMLVNSLILDLITDLFPRINRGVEIELNVLNGYDVITAIEMAQ